MIGSEKLALCVQGNQGRTSPGEHDFRRDQWFAAAIRTWAGLKLSFDMNALGLCKTCACETCQPVIDDHDPHQPRMSGFRRSLQVVIRGHQQMDDPASATGNTHLRLPRQAT